MTEEAHSPIMVPVRGGSFTIPQIVEALAEPDARCVRFDYCISFILVTVRYTSPIYFTRSHDARLFRGLGYSALCVLLGLWGFPWGPILSIRAIWNNFHGGQDATDEMQKWLRARIYRAEAVSGISDPQHD